MFIYTEMVKQMLLNARTISDIFWNVFCNCFILIKIDSLFDQYKFNPNKAGLFEGSFSLEGRSI